MPSMANFFPSTITNHPSWVDEFLDFSSARRGAHRRSMSDSIAFLEQPLVEEECRDSNAMPMMTTTTILANRQSAQRSRVRKLQYISQLERSVTTLQTEVSALSPRVAFLDHQRLILNVDNSALKQRIAALAQDKIFKDGTIC
ncbi:hypothetical protein GOBAR_AA10653 [Gossypium barbadense]|uniref:BZIP domain-containing protein n=1 Tax=Gossypium barbadense TaxID=3634 RepID=A0A2P5Y309_GOSBA|nr:hypothetical protein GOBAR_AA10653 [Gossypium barbadense]